MCQPVESLEELFGRLNDLLLSNFSGIGRLVARYIELGGTMSLRSRLTCWSAEPMLKRYKFELTSYDSINSSSSPSSPASSSDGT